jgi:hypothetical protein
MTEDADKRTRGVQRYFVASHRTASVQVIPFDQLTCSGHIVRIADLSIIGVGIESPDPIEPGLACFDEPVSGHRFGVVAWCRQKGDRYRAGISFVTLSHPHEQYILNQLSLSPRHKALRDPEKILETLLKDIKPGTSS